MSICGITLNTTGFALVFYFYFSISMRLFKKGEKHPKCINNDIKIYVGNSGNALFKKLRNKLKLSF